MTLYTPEFESKQYDLFSMAVHKSINKDDDSEITDYEVNENHNYVAITFHYKNEDCLSVNSLFYNLATNYLRNLTNDYLNY